MNVEKCVADTVFIVVKDSMTQHLERCRIGACYGTPNLDNGWSLVSFMKGGHAAEIFSAIMETLGEVKASNYDVVNDAWLIPHRVLDKWMTSTAEILHLRSPTEPEMRYFPVCEDLTEEFVALKDKVDKIKNHRR